MKKSDELKQTVDALCTEVNDLQAQEQMSKQTEQMLGAFGIKRGA